jgi:glycosyltransferase involved in cell wall biosynthesis
VIVAHYRDWERKHPDRLTLLATLYDVWVLTNPQLADVEHILSWVPLDHMTMPPKVEAWLRRPNVVPVAMSKFGKQQLEAKDIEGAYIPHVIEDVWRKSSGGGEILGVPDDAYLVMMNAANKGTAPTRKAWTENLLALSVFMKARPDVWLYLHTEAKTPFGIDIEELAHAVGIPKDRLRFAGPYQYRMGTYTQEILAKLYTRADVLLAVSMGEGFGIPTVEAQACGTRVIGSDTSATPELLADPSLLVEGQPEWDPGQSAFFFRPFVHSITKTLEAAYNLGGGYSHAAVSKAGEYRADKVVKRDWFSLIDRIAG